MILSCMLFGYHKLITLGYTRQKNYHHIYFRDE